MQSSVWDHCLATLRLDLTEQQFNKTWNTLKGMVGLMQTDYQLEDLTYEEVYGLPTNTEHSC